MRRDRRSATWLGVVPLRTATARASIERVLAADFDPMASDGKARIRAALAQA
jgi:hypothetical protein